MIKGGKPGDRVLMWNSQKTASTEGIIVEIVKAWSYPEKFHPTGNGSASRAGESYIVSVHGGYRWPLTRNLTFADATRNQQASLFEEGVWDRR